MNLIWIENARRVLVSLYGDKRGPAVCSAVIPGVMRDFRAMLAAAAEGEIVRETYRLDDGAGELQLTGRRTAKGAVLTRMVIGGRIVDLGEEELTL